MYKYIKISRFIYLYNLISILKKSDQNERAKNGFKKLLFKG